MRYLEGKTLDQCADATGVTRDSVRQQQINAVRTLGSGKHRKILIKYAGSDLHSNAMHGSVAAFQRTFTSSTEKVAIQNVEKHRRALDRIAAFIQMSEEGNGS